MPAQRGRRLNAGDAKRGGTARISPDFAYGARGGAGLVSFERARSAASSGGRSFAGLGRNRRRRAAEVAACTGAQRKRSYGVLSSKRRGWGVSTRCGECNGLEPVTKRSPEPCRRRAPRRRVQTQAERRLRELKRPGERGERMRGSPRGARKARGWLSSSSSRRSRRRRRRPEEEGDGVGGDVGGSGSSRWSGRTGSTRRSSWTCRGREESTVVA